MQPNYGIVTAFEIGPSAYNVIVGTSLGYILVWDLRYQLVSQAWQHSSLRRIVALVAFDAASVLPRTRSNHFQHAQSRNDRLLFIAAEGHSNPEWAAFEITTGLCRIVLRVVSSPSNVVLPVLLAVPCPPASAVGELSQQFSLPSTISPSLSYAQPSISAKTELLLQRAYLLQQAQKILSAPVDTAPASYFTGLLCCRENFAITSGSDSIVRFWDFREPAQSYHITEAQNRRSLAPLSTTATLSSGTVVFEETCLGDPSMLPLSSEQAPRIGSPVNNHSDVITDLKAFETVTPSPNKMLLTASRDNTIKVWI